MNMHMHTHDCIPTNVVVLIVERGGFSRGLKVREVSTSDIRIPRPCVVLMAASPKHTIDDLGRSTPAG